MQSLNQMGEPRIGPERIHHRIGNQIANAVSSIKGFLKPLESFVLLAELTVDGSDQIGRDVIELRLALERVQDRSRL